MSAYIVVQVDVQDPERYAKYKDMVPPTLEAYGGRFVVRGRKHVSLDEGYFVLGDDSQDSHDSRYTGSVAREDIIGRAMLIVWPPDRIGWVHQGS